MDVGSVKDGGDVVPDGIMIVLEDWLDYFISEFAENGGSCESVEM